MDTITQNLDKGAIIAALRAFAEQRPGLDPRNYISDWRDAAGRSAYNAERRSILRDLHDARTLLRTVELSGVSADALARAFKDAYSGRLTLNVDGSLEYCTGQYWPTEFRRAVCAVCASALWHYYRESVVARDGESMGDAIRRNFKAMFGARMQKRWFD